MTEIERLNRWLENFGRGPSGKILYRLVWSDKIFENRFGTFNDFSESGLFLRQVKETRLVRKYNYIKERWVFEKWAPGDLTANKETPDSLSGDYIPVYVFEDSKGNYLQPNERALKFIIDVMNGQVRKENPPSQEMLEDKEIENQVDTMMDSPDFRTSGATRNAVAYTKELKNVS